MFDTSNSGGQHSLFRRQFNRFWPWALSGVVGLLLAHLVVTPSYAWWFTAPTDSTAIAPTQQTGLVVGPITKSLVPQFLLQPLTQPKEEKPPSVQAKPVATPQQQHASAPQPTLAVTTFTKQESAAPAAGYSSRAQQILSLVNQQRAAHGLVQLSLNPALTRSAQSYAELMSQTGHFGHTGPDGSSFIQRNVAAGYTGWQWLEENIAYGYTSANEVMEGWMRSEHHRDNILKPEVRELGVGIAGSSPIYWVQEFGSR